MIRAALAATISLDRWLLLTVRRLESRAMTRLMRGFTRLGNPSTWVLVGLVLALSGGDGPHRCALLGSAAALALALSEPLKRVCRRQRPDRGIGGFAALADNPDAFSFPSGHTAVAFAVAFAFASPGSALGALVLVVAIGIAVSRVYLGAHYPLDVAAGVLLGSVAGTAARMLVGQYPLLKLVGYAMLAAIS
ncbi:MAG: phosphatase PAP2 family protein [Acidobacteria bacterium]|nr:phosphatase PAP2 family protein [Acidobacteriota bacterium]